MSGSAPLRAKWHQRLCSATTSAAINTCPLSEPKVHEIILLLVTYPDVVRSALKQYEASTVVTFCFKLFHLISSAWETVIVKGQEEELATGAVVTLRGGEDCPQQCIDTTVDQTS